MTARRAGSRPKSEEMVIRISEGPTAASRHEARIPDLSEDHDSGAGEPTGSEVHEQIPELGRFLQVGRVCRCFKPH
jgi:hypothetical protein